MTRRRLLAERVEDMRLWSILERVLASPWFLSLLLVVLCFTGTLLLISAL